MLNKNVSYNSLLIKELDTISSKFLSTYKAKNTNLVRFFDGDFIDRASYLASTVFPNGKVAIFYTIKTLDDYAEKLNIKLKSVGLDTINFVVDSDNTLDVNKLNKYFLLPDDVRGIIVTDSTLIKMTEYICSVKNIALVAPINDFIFKPISNRIYVKNGNEIDYVKVSLDRYFIVDTLSLSKSDKKADAYALIMGRLISLLDYRVRTCVDVKNRDVNLYNFAKESIVKVFNIFSYNYQSQTELLIYTLLKLELANLYLDGELDDFSAVNNACYLYGSSEILMDAIGAFINLYSVGFSSDYDNILSVVDYNEIFDELKDKSYLNQLDLLKSLLDRSNTFINNSEKLKSYSLNLTAEVDGLKKAYQKIKKSFILLGGKLLTDEQKDEKRYVDAIKYAGDLPLSFNGMSILSEKGINRLIQ